MTDTINTNTTGTAIAPEQLATILTAVAQALGGQAQGASAAAPAVGTDTQAAAPVAAAPIPAPVPAAGAVAPVADPAAAGNVQTASPAATLAAGAAAPLPDAATGAVSGNESESLALLKNIDTNVTDLSTRIKSIEKTAIRNGAIAGGVAGGVSGGIVATGVAFIRAHLGI